MIRWNDRAVFAAAPSEPEESESICGLTDDRVPSSDPRVARPINVEGNAAGTAFLFEGRSNCLLTAGHVCARNTLVSVEF